MIPNLVKAYNEENQPIFRVTNVRTICEILNSVSSNKTMFKQVCNLIKIPFIVPVTIATTECSFSTLSRLKTFLNSTMLQTALNYVMLLNIDKKRTDLLDIKEITKQLISGNDRRHNYFGSFELYKNVNFVIIILFLL